jgi:RNA polymerase sigma factor (sigma-70 family)
MKKKIGQRSFTRFKKGNLRDFELLYQAYYSFARHNAFCLPDTDTQKQVILDDVFLKVWIRREMFKDLAHLQRYLGIMVMRASLTYLRDGVTEKSAVEGETRISESIEDGTDTKGENLRNLYMHLAGLTFINRLIIKLHFAEGKTNVEIARLLNVSANSIAIRKHRMFKSFKIQMDRPGWG